MNRSCIATKSSQYQQHTKRVVTNYQTLSGKFEEDQELKKKKKKNATHILYKNLLYQLINGFKGKLISRFIVHFLFSFIRRIRVPIPPFPRSPTIKLSKKKNSSLLS
jgi:hypothetical protein